MLIFVVRKTKLVCNIWSILFAGDSILDNDEVFTITPLQIHCINRRLLLPLPTCGMFKSPYLCRVFQKKGSPTITKFLKLIKMFVDVNVQPVSGI